ncbi:MAG: RES family NAD+ phosphorylase [Pseudomonadota bacterium]
MEALFSRVGLADIHQNLARNIVSLRQSQNLFDDLSDDPADWQRAQGVEDAVKPPTYQSNTPVIHRPFEDAAWFNAIGYPFQHWQASRFSDGRFGIWYGSDSIETTVHETVHHWLTGLLDDAGFRRVGVIAERKVYWVRCDAALVDLRPLAPDYPDLVHPTDYRFTQAIGARLHREGHPGLATRSARCPGDNFALLNPNLLSTPQIACHLTYRTTARGVQVEKQVGKTWLRIPA